MGRTVELRLRQTMDCGARSRVIRSIRTGPLVVATKTARRVT